MTSRRLVTFVALMVAIPGVSGAQKSTLIGSVTADSAGKHGIDGVEVSIPALKRTVRTNAEGVYMIDGLTLGHYWVTVRSIGYRSTADSINIDVTDGTLLNFVLTHNGAPLPAVTTTGKPEYFSPGLRSFEERRASGFGSFISEAELRKHDNDRLSDILPRLAGLRFVRTSRGTFVTSSHNKANTSQSSTSVRAPARGATASATAATAAAASGRPSGLPPGCYSTVYENRTRIYDMQLTPTQMPPSVDDINIDRLAGVEYYAGDDVAPSGFRSSGCGVLIIWYREK